MSAAELDPHLWLPEPELAFHPDRVEDRHAHPLRGLLEHGPYSAGLVMDPIRVATIAPHREGEPLYTFMGELRQAHTPRERREYLPTWPGFRTVFNVKMAAAKGRHVQLPADADGRMSASTRPHADLAELLTRAIDELAAHRADFDVIFIYLPERWAAGFEGDEGEDFDLHDHLKAFTALRGIPIQLVREGKALSYACRASVMWRIGLALYAKAGGIPWKLADVEPEAAYIGLSYAVRAQGSAARFVTCCSQVFDEQGGGLEFIAYDARDVRIERDNPFLSRNEMFKVMTRSMDVYRRRHAGRVPRRVVVHKTTEFKRDEVEGCFDALHVAESVDLVQVVENTGWRGMRIDRPRQGEKKGRPAPFPLARGSLLPIGDYEALLWTQGDVRDIAPRGSFYQGGKSIPEPLKLVRHAGHGPWNDTARAVLSLSKMDWNNDALYDRLPVTLGYAKVLARTVKRMPSLGSHPYQFRFFM
ncbi:MAG: hypothetical protein AB1416_02305 [Actinomycetota bacterium]